MTKTNKIILAAVIAVAVIAGLVYLTKPKMPAQTVSSELNTYWQERLNSVAVAKVGQPIEGFDAGIFMQAYPGLVATDFVGVKTSEGQYRMVAGGLEWYRTANQPITSAEKMIVKDGYTTLLTNVSMRLGNVVTSTSNIDQIITSISK